MAVVEMEGAERWSAALPPSTASVPAARHFTRDAVQGLGAGSAEERAVLLVSELATNAVLHARTPLRLSVYRTRHGLRVEVRDDDPTPPRAMTPDPLRPGGRGILLVDALSDAWGVNGNNLGKTIWFELAA